MYSGNRVFTAHAVGVGCIQDVQWEYVYRVYSWNRVLEEGVYRVYSRSRVFTWSTVGA